MTEQCLATQNVMDDNEVLVGILVCIGEPHDKKTKHTWSEEYKLSHNRKSVKPNE